MGGEGLADKKRGSGASAETHSQGPRGPETVDSLDPSLMTLGNLKHSAEFCFQPLVFQLALILMPKNLISVIE